MGEYANWLRELNKDEPISGLTAAVWPDSPQPGTKEHKAFLEDVKNSAVLPNRRAMRRYF